MNAPEREVLADLVGKFLEENIEKSPAFRALARYLAEQTLRSIESWEDSNWDDAGAQTQDREPAGAEKTGDDPEAQPRVNPSPTPPLTTAVVPLRIGDARTEIPVSGESNAISAAHEAARSELMREGHAEDYLLRTAEARAIDLAQISSRCRLKAEACRHQILRQSQQRDSQEEYESRQRMNELISTAKSMENCFLWMFFRRGTPSTESQLELIAGCYDAMADAADLCRAIEPIDAWQDDEQVRLALQLLATMSSGLRVSLADTWLTQPDIDQDEVHRWLKLVTAEHRYHVKRHMQLSDPADPQVDVPAARERAIQLLAEISDQQANREKAERLLKRALYHAQRVRDAWESPYDEEPPRHDCEKVNGAIEKLIEIAPSNLDSLIAEIASVASIECFPESVTPHHRLRVAAEAQASDDAQTQPRKPRENVTRARSWSEDVRRVRELIDGGQIVVIGGEPRRDAIDRIVEAFALDGLVWPELTEHGSAEPMRAPISNPQTKLVVVLIKLTGHEHAERAREFSRQASVPYVLMPAGYNPEQIAAEVLRQASAQLRSA